LMLPASITETIRVTVFAAARSWVDAVCLQPSLPHQALIFAPAHAGGSSCCCACLVMQILKIKTAVNNNLQTRPPFFISNRA
jgi:hypothetical protein